MININYDPILGCTGWDITPPEREPITCKEVVQCVTNFINRSKKKPLITNKDKIKNKRESKQIRTVWEAKKEKNELL